MASEAAEGLHLRPPSHPGHPWNSYHLLSPGSLSYYGQPSHDFPVAVTPAGRPGNALSYAANEAVHGRNVVLVPQPPPSPLQQWIPSGRDSELNPAYCVGAPVKLCYLSSPATKMYDKMVGDIVKTQSTPSGYVFDVRCTLFPLALKNRHLNKDEGHYKVPVSKAAAQGAKKNRAILGPAYGMSEADAEMDDGEGSALPPFVLVNSLPSEKLDPLSTGEAAAGGPPKLVRPPIWGPPLTPEERTMIEERFKKAAEPVPPERRVASVWSAGAAPGTAMPPTSPLAQYQSRGVPDVGQNAMTTMATGIQGQGMHTVMPGTMGPGMMGGMIPGTMGPGMMGSHMMGPGMMGPGPCMEQNMMAHGPMAGYPDFPQQHRRPRHGVC